MQEVSFFKPNQPTVTPQLDHGGKSSGNRRGWLNVLRSYIRAGGGYLLHRDRPQLKITHSFYSISMLQLYRWKRTGYVKCTPHEVASTGHLRIFVFNFCTLPCTRTTSSSQWLPQLPQWHRPLHSELVIELHPFHPKQSWFKPKICGAREAGDINVLWWRGTRPL